jgi:hypothetical protein
VATTDRTDPADARGQDAGTGDLQEVRAPANGADAELKPGEVRFATPADAEAYRRACAEIDADPERWKDYAWEDNGEGGPSP